MGPGPLDLEPDTDDGVCCGQLLLPDGHLLQEIAHKLGRHHVLKLNLMEQTRHDGHMMCDTSDGTL